VIHPHPVHRTFVSIREGHLQIATLTRGTVALTTLVLTKYLLCSCLVNFPPFRTNSTVTSVSLAKKHRHPFHGSIATATRPSDVIHSDVVGPLPPSHSRSRYLVTFVDEFTRYVTIFEFIQKSAVLDSFKVFIVKLNVSIQLQSRVSTQTTGGSTHQLPHMLYNLAFPYIALPRALRRPMELLNAKIDPYSKWLGQH
jgi:hypothetical protein